MVSKEQLKQLVFEELTKSEVSSMISSKMDSHLKSMDFKRKVKEITSDVIENLFKTLYQRNGMWKNAIK